MSATFRSLTFPGEWYLCYPACTEAPGAGCSTASFLTQAWSIRLHKTRHPKASVLDLGLRDWDMQSRNDTDLDEFRTGLRSGLPRPVGTDTGDRVSSSSRELWSPQFAHTRRSVSLSACCKTKNVSSIHSDLFSGNVDLIMVEKSAEQQWTSS